MAGTGTATILIDASSPATDIGSAINSLSPGSAKRIGSYVIGNKVRFYTYDVSA
jgi:hypothetical protein